MQLPRTCLPRLVFPFYPVGTMKLRLTRGDDFPGLLPRTWIAAACFFAVFLITGCSSFNRAWKKSAAIPPEANSLAGRWEGTWLSNVNGHNDQLRCLMSPVTNGIYSARFHAKYRRGILRFTFGYTAELTVREEEGTFQFQGESNLGWYAGGVYRYAGTASGTNFFSTYDSKYDRGFFRMTRPANE